jgi:hypothetical protein
MSRPLAKSANTVVFIALDTPSKRSMMSTIATTADEGDGFTRWTRQASYNGVNNCSLSRAHELSFRRPKTPERRKFIRRVRTEV